MQTTLSYIIKLYILSAKDNSSGKSSVTYEFGREMSRDQSLEGVIYLFNVQKKLYIFNV